MKQLFGIIITWISVRSSLLARPLVIGCELGTIQWNGAHDPNHLELSHSPNVHHPKPTLYYKRNGG